MFILHPLPTLRTAAVPVVLSAKVRPTAIHIGEVWLDQVQSSVKVCLVEVSAMWKTHRKSSTTFVRYSSDDVCP